MVTPSELSTTGLIEVETAGPVAGGGRVVGITGINILLVCVSPLPLVNITAILSIVVSVPARL